MPRRPDPRGSRRFRRSKSYITTRVGPAARGSARGRFRRSAWRPGPAGSTVRAGAVAEQNVACGEARQPGGTTVWQAQPVQLCPGGRGAFGLEAQHGSVGAFRRRWSGSGSWRPHWSSPAPRRSSIRVIAKPSQRSRVMPRYAGQRHPPLLLRRRAARPAPRSSAVSASIGHHFVSVLALRVAVSATMRGEGRFFLAFGQGGQGALEPFEQVVEQVGTFRP